MCVCVQGSRNYMLQNEPELHGFRKVVVVGSHRFSIRPFLEKNHYPEELLIWLCRFWGKSGLDFGGFRGVLLAVFRAPELHGLPGHPCNSGFPVVIRPLVISRHHPSKAKRPVSTLAAPQQCPGSAPLAAQERPRSDLGWPRSTPGSYGGNSRPKSCNQKAGLIVKESRRISP